MLWYFAYGSNLNPDRLQGRANIEPRRSERAMLYDWRLAFNLATGMRWVEPAMANVMPASGEVVHGVAFELTDAELARLKASEGGTRFYRSQSVEVETYDGERLAALTFVAQQDVVRREVSPSARYLDLLRKGARHHRLAEDYCALVDAQAVATPNALSPWVRRLFGALEHPRARYAREAFLLLVHQLARAEARSSLRRGATR